MTPSDLTTLLLGRSRLLDDGNHFTCHYCGHMHQAVKLEPGTHAECVRCGTTLAKGPRSPDTALAFTITGAMLVIPAYWEPLITAGKFGSYRDVYFFSGVRSLWNIGEGMSVLAGWILICGAIAPMCLLALLAMVLAAARSGRRDLVDGPLGFAAQACERWSMPEVQLLAVLVAFMRIGSLVEVQVNAGLWCYAALSLSVLLAWRSFDLEALQQPAMEAGFRERKKS